jgi:hypothetical protein
MMHYDAGWVPEQIPDSAVRIPSMLYMVRLMYTERLTNCVTKKKSLKETELVKRVKARGRTDEEILEEASVALPVIAAQSENTDEMMSSMSDFQDYRPGPTRDPYQVSKDKDASQFQGSALIDFLRLDVFADICGRDPVSSLNLVMITNHMFFLFMEIEDRFREARHPLWVEVYEHPDLRLRQQKRVALVVAAMSDQEDKAMKLFAQAFEKMRTGAFSCIFWEDLREGESGMRTKHDEDEVHMDQCSIM